MGCVLVRAPPPNVLSRSIFLSRSLWCTFYPFHVWVKLCFPQLPLFGFCVHSIQAYPDLSIWLLGCLSRSCPAGMTLQQIRKCAWGWRWIVGKLAVKVSSTLQYGRWGLFAELLQSSERWRTERLVYIGTISASCFYGKMRLYWVHGILAWSRQAGSFRVRGRFVSCI